MRWRDGMDIAEQAAWARKGQDSPNFYIYRRLIGPGLIAAGVAGLGYAAYRGWHGLAAAPASSGVPVVMWFLLALLVPLTVFAVKGRGRARPFGVLVLVSLATALAWLFWLGAMAAVLF